MKNKIKVVGAILENYNGEVLCTLRNKDSIFGNLWEFPGGKIENNETPQQSLKREILEELNIKIGSSISYMKVEKEYDDFIIELECFKCEILNDLDIISMVHDKVIWLKRENLLSLNWIPTDISIVEKLSEENVYNK